MVIATGLTAFRFPDKPTTCTPDFLKYSRNMVSQSKYDGWRLQIYNSSSQLRLPCGANAKPGINVFSRMGKPFPNQAKMSDDILSQIKDLDIPDGTVLDAEFVGPRGGLKQAVYIFDCLALSGDWLTNVDFIERWSLCNELFKQVESDNIFLADTRHSGYGEHFEQLKKEWIESGMGLHLFEGIVLKHINGKLELNLKSSATSRSMFKLKYRDVTEERF